jgi:hypothetical protein
LEPLINVIIEKMAYLAEFWLILERNLVEHVPHKIFVEWTMKMLHRILQDYTLTKKFGITEFGYVMKNL